MAIRLRKLFLRFFLLSTLLFVLLMGLLTLVLYHPKVQTFAVKKATTYLSNKLDTTVSIRSLKLRPFKTIVVRDFYLEDTMQDTLFYSDKLKIKLKGIQNLNPFKSKFHIQSVDVQNAKINLYRTKDMEKLNIALLFGGGEEKKNRPPKSKSAKFPDVDVRKFTFSNVSFILDDQLKTSYEKIRVPSLEMNVKEIDLENKLFHLTSFETNGIVVEVGAPGKKYKIEKKKKRKPYEIDIGWNFKIDELRIKEGLFTFDNASKSHNSEAVVDGGFIELKRIDCVLKEVRYDSLIQARADKILLQWMPSLSLNEFSGDLYFGQEGFKVSRLRSRINNSKLKGDFKVSIPVTRLKNFTDEANLYAHVKQFKFDKVDATLFSKELDKYIKEDIEFSGIASGKIDALKLQEALITSGVTTLSGDFNVEGIRNFETANFDLKVDRLATNSSELKRYQELVQLPESLAEVGEINFTGDFNGTLNDFSAQGKLYTGLGGLESNLKINRDQITNTTNYSGDFKGHSLNIGKYLDSDQLGEVDFNMQLNGSGFKLDELDSKIIGTIPSFEFNGYTYENIAVEGTLDKRLFEGKINIDDDCLVFDFLGKVDLNDSLPFIDCEAHISNADLQNLNITKEKLLVSLDGYIAFIGNDIENINGDMSLDNLQLSNNNSTIDVEEIDVNFISLDDGFKEYSLDSRDIEGYIRGLFNPIDAPKEVIRHLSDYSHYINSKDTSQIKAQEFEAAFAIEQDFGLIKFFAGDFKSGSKIKLASAFNNTKDLFELAINTDSIVYNNISLKNLAINAQNKGDRFIEINTDLNAINLGQKVAFDQASIELKSSNQDIHTDIDISIDSVNSIKQLSQVYTSADSTVFRLLESSIFLNNKEWLTPANSKLIFKDSLLIANNVKLFQEEQYIQLLNGKTDLSENQIKINALNLSDIGQLLLDTSLIENGYLSGNIKIKDALGNMNAIADIAVTDAHIMDFKIDEIHLSGDYDKFYGKANAQLAIDDDEYQVDLKGNYNLGGNDYNAADFDINVGRLPLNFIDLFIGKTMRTDAIARGDLKFRGSVKKPIVEGTCSLLDTAHLSFPFLGTTYSFKDEITLKENEIYLGSINIKDEFENGALLEGKITHDYFKDITLDLSIFTDRFNFMNTTLEENDQFYGKVFGEGNVSIKGITNDLKIDAEVKTLPISSFSIPLSNKKDVQEYDFIRFFNPSDTSTVIDEAITDFKVKGISLDLKLDVTPDVLLELVLNSENNDKLSARGEGALEVELNTLGDFNMRGIYTIASGEYTLTLQNFIKKPFTLKTGSTVSWNGPVDEAELNVDAIYSVRVPLETVDSASNTTSQKVDVDVELELRGALNATDVRFDIVPGSTSNSQLETLLSEVKQDENTLNTQVIGLLVFNRFLPVDNTAFADLGTGFGAAFGTNTALEFLSIQISEYLTGAIAEFISEDIRLDLNIQTYDQTSTGEDNQTSTSQTGEVQLNYQHFLLDGRLLLNIGGDFEFGDRPEDVGNQRNGIAGDFLVEYAITKDGRFKIKAFHKTSEYDIFNEERSKTGVGLSYAKDFDKAKELFQIDTGRKNKRGNRRDDRKIEKQNATNRLNEDKE